MKPELEFEKLFFDTQTMIYNLGMRLFKRNEEDALDFVQDVYLQAYKKRNSFQGRSKPSTWLYALALNLGLNKIKKNKKVHLSNDFEMDDLYASKDDQPDTIVLEMLNQKEINHKIEKALWEIPENYRLPIVLYYFEKMSYKEIAKSLQIPEGTIKSCVYRGKIILRNLLKDEYAT